MYGIYINKKNIIEQLEYPWFMLINLFYNKIEEFTSEDVTFNMSLTNKGFNIIINPNVRVGHEKKIVYIDK